MFTALKTGRGEGSDKDILAVHLDGFVNEEKDLSRYLKRSFPSEDEIAKIPRVGRVLLVKLSLIKSKKVIINCT